MIFYYYLDFANFIIQRKGKRKKGKRKKVTKIDLMYAITKYTYLLFY